jgi:hypothetical protein
MDRENLYNALMDVLIYLENGAIGEAKLKLESITDNIKYDTGKY